MANEQNKESYYDMVDENEMTFSPMSPHFPMDVPEASGVSPMTPIANRTTQGQAALSVASSRGAPAYSYPSALSTARAGTRGDPIGMGHMTSTIGPPAPGSGSTSSDSQSPGLLSQTTTAGPSLTLGPAAIVVTEPSLYASRPIPSCPPYPSYPSASQQAQYHRQEPPPPQHIPGWNSTSGNNSLYRGGGSDNLGSSSQMFDFGFSTHDAPSSGPASYGSEYLSPSIHQQQPPFAFGGYTPDPNPWHDGPDPALSGPASNSHLHTISSTLSNPHGIADETTVGGIIYGSPPENDGLNAASSSPPPVKRAKKSKSKSKSSSAGKRTQSWGNLPSSQSPDAMTTVSYASLTSSTSGVSSTAGVANPNLAAHSHSSSVTTPGSTSTSGAAAAGAGGAGTAAAAAAINKSKLRSASRTSKNTHHKPAETAEERKSRASHNLVEKQYRNRLNAQFESLLTALPDSTRLNDSSGNDNGEGPSFGGGGGGGGGGVGDGEKRVSKAEVLDMATRYIRQLEKERVDHERERNELLENMDRLKETYSKGVSQGNQSMMPPQSMGPVAGPTYSQSLGGGRYEYGEDEGGIDVQDQMQRR